MKPLTRRELDTLNAIAEYTNLHNYSPTVRDIADMVNSKSASTVHKFLVSLKSKGYIEYEPSKPRTITIKVFDNSKVFVTTYK